jgi:hypothetical protein
MCFSFFVIQSCVPSFSSVVFVVSVRERGEGRNRERERERARESVSMCLCMCASLVGLDALKVNQNYIPFSLAHTGEWHSTFCHGSGVP